MARCGMFHRIKLRDNAIGQVVLDGIDTNHGHDAPPEKPVMPAHHI